jgi:hypothetical protein
MAAPGERRPLATRAGEPPGARVSSPLLGGVAPSSEVVTPGGATGSQRRTPSCRAPWASPACCGSTRSRYDRNGVSPCATRGSSAKSSRHARSCGRQGGITGSASIRLIRAARPCVPARHRPPPDRRLSLGRLDCFGEDVTDPEGTVARCKALLGERPPRPSPEIVGERPHRRPCPRLPPSPGRDGAFQES